MLRKLAVIMIGAVTLAAAFDVEAACMAANANSALVEDTPTGAFTDHGNGTVTHTVTGLMWKKCAQGQSGVSCSTGSATTLAWAGALASAVSDATAGHTDWRLPNKKELESIVEGCGYSPAINLAIFPNTPSGTFWSGTTYATDAPTAWSVDFIDGANFNDPKTATLRVRLVRAGQPLDSFDAQVDGPPVTAVLDVDDSAPSTKYDALTDGLITIRYLFGLTGAALTNGALGGTAKRTDPTVIKNYLDTVRPQLDIDGNNVADALTDGLLIIRYLFGLRGNALINNAFDPMGSRTTALLIEQQIQLLTPP